MEAIRVFALIKISSPSMDFPLLSAQSKEKFAAGYAKTVGNSKDGASTSIGSVGSDGLMKDGSSSSNGLKKDSPLSFADVTSGKLSHCSDWSPLVGEKNLSYYQPVKKEGKRFVKLPSSVCENAVMLWEDSLVAQFVGVVPSYNLIQGAANSL